MQCNLLQYHLKLNLNNYLPQVVVIWWTIISYSVISLNFEKKRFGELQLPRNPRLGNCAECIDSQFVTTLCIAQLCVFEENVMEIEYFCDTLPWLKRSFVLELASKSDILFSVPQFDLSPRTSFWATPTPAQTRPSLCGQLKHEFIKDWVTR